MPIKVACKCGQKFSARDAMAGKRVKCPKCNDPLTIPKPRRSSSKTSGTSRRAGMTDLLDEVGVKNVRSGPVCPECGADVEPNAVICISCGFNSATGRKMYSESDQGDGMAGMSSAEKLVAKAERELDEAPLVGADNNFGDGGDSWLIAGVAALVGVTMVCIAVGAIFLMDQLPQSYTVSISLMAALGIVAIGFWWIVIAGFQEHLFHGFLLLFSPALAILLSVGLYLLFGLFDMPSLGRYLGGVIGMAYFYYFTVTRGMWLPFGMYVGGQQLAEILFLVLLFSQD